MASNYSDVVLVSTCTNGADNVFGPVVAPPCRRGFDFTLLFEQSILSIGASCIFLLIVPSRLFWLYRSKVTVVSRYSAYTRKAVCLSCLNPSYLLESPLTITFKSPQAAISLLIGLQLALLILWTSKSALQTSASVPSAVLAFVGALAMYPLSYLEHTRSVRPSTLLEVYLLVSLLLNIPQARTLFLRHNEPTAIAAIFVATIGAMLIVWILEARNKTKDLKEPYKEYPPEATHGVWNRTFFLWLNPLLVKGFKKLLSLDDLWQTLPNLSSEKLRDEMQVVWDRRCELRLSFNLHNLPNFMQAKPEHRYALIWACTKCLCWPLLAAVPARLCLIGFNYAQPFLINRMIKFVSEPRDSSKYYNHSLGLIAAAGVIYIGVAVSTVRYMHQVYRSITMLRGGLVGLIFSKTLVLRDGVYDESAAVTHMSTDIDRIVASMQNMHEVWARLVEVAIGVWLLSIQIGAVSVIPIIVVVREFSPSRDA
jgi:ATP-binding cassette, subfamily C (CFTR/MRP), member 1